MADWYLNPALTRFRNEVNARWPRRDKASDGTIGDAAHQATSSDHNPDRDGSVDAWDMDNNGVDVNAVIAAALKHEAIAYVIWNRRITSRNQAGGLGTWHPYTGASPHTEHVHFNTREAYENSAKPWFTEEDMALTDDDITKLLNRNLTPSSGTVTVGQCLLDAHRIWALMPDTAKAAAAAAGRTDALMGMKDVVTAWSNVNPDAVQVNELANKINNPPAAGGIAIDYAQLAAALAGAIPAELAGALANELAARLQG